MHRRIARQCRLDELLSVAVLHDGDCENCDQSAINGIGVPLRNQFECSFQLKPGRLDEDEFVPPGQLRHWFPALSIWDQLIDRVGRHDPAPLDKLAR
jgi:hypothetical protein